MKTAAICLFCLMLLITFNTVAQRIEMPVFSKAKSSTFKSQKLILKLNLEYQSSKATLCMNIIKPPGETELRPMPEGVYYTAFFCKMETRLRDLTNIWIKFRVGDFDDYENTFWMANKKP